MASIIRIKRSSTSGNPTTLGAGELAYSALTDNGSNGGDRLYIGIGNETAGNAANHFVVGGKYFTDMMDHTRGTLTASSAILVDADSKIDNLKVDNLDFNGNTISSTNTNGNITLDPAGTGYVEIVGTNGLVIPVGTTLQRGPAVQGAVRYNTTTSSFEGYSGSTWGSLGGVKSVDGLTYITAESSPGASDDTLTFVTDGTNAMSLDTDSLDIASKISTVNINATTASSSTTSGALVVDGGVGIAGNLNVGGTLDVTGTVTYTGGATFNSNLTLVGSDTDATEYFKVKNGSGVDKFVVDSASGNTTIAGTLGVTGEATFASATVSDLTSGRVVLAGASGSLNDSGNLTFNGTTLAVTGNETISGTLGVTGEATFASATVSDLTSGRVVLAGTAGSLNDSGNLTFNGTTLAITGNETVSGTLDVTGAVGIDGNFDIATNKFTVAAASGNTSIAGTLGVAGAVTLSSTLGITGDLSVNTNKFTVAASSGNTVIAGTLDVDGAVNLNSSLVVDGATTIGASGARVATTVYGAAVSVTGSDNSEIGVTAGAAGTKTLTITASNSVGDANLDINVDDAATLDATVISLDSTDSSNFSMTANSSSTKTLTIDASNAGTGAGNIAIGSSSTDNTTVTSATKTTITGTSEVEINSDTLLDVNVGGTITIDSTSTTTLTASGITLNADTLTIQGTEGALDTSNVSIAGRLDVDNMRLDGNTISTTDGSNTLYLDPAPSGSAGLVVIEGNLQVNGTQTTINSTTVTIDDPIFVLGGDATPSSDDNLDRGIEFQWHNGTSAKLGFFGYDDSASEFVFVPDATDTSGVITGDLGAVAFGTLRLAGTTASTTTNTGAFTVAGGVGIGGQLNVAGTTNKFTSTQGSSSTSTGAVVVSGGLGLAQNLYMGGNLVGAGASTSALDGFDIDGGTY